MKPARSSVDRARKLRREMTPPERRLWQALRTRPGGFKFRKQHPLGPYTLDFYCHEAALAIEVDGIAHERGDRPERDEKRDLWLSRKGIETLRFLAPDIVGLEGVVSQIVTVCRSRTP